MSVGIAPVARIIRESLPDIDRLTGQMLWGLVVNRDVRLPGGETVSGSFRWWGGIMAEAVGEGDYLDYYCHSWFLKSIMEGLEPGLYDKKEGELRGQLEDLGWEFIEVR